MKIPNGYSGQIIGFFASLETGTPRIETLHVGQIPQSQGFSVSLSDGSVLSERFDYQANLDAYFHQSDDGDRDYAVLHVLEIGDTPTQPHSIPSLEGTQAAAKGFATTLTSAFVAGNLLSEDLAWGLRVLNSPVWLYGLWKTNGNNIQAAQKEFLSLMNR